MMNYNKLFALAKEKGITAVSVSKTSKSEFSFSLFHGEMDSYSLNSDRNYIIRGIYNNKFGSVSTEVEDIDYIVDNIITNAKVNEKTEEAEIFKGSKSYKKRDYFNKELEAYPVDKKIATIKEIETKLKAYDSRVSEVQVSYSEISEESEIRNSYGLKLKTKSNYYYVGAEVVVVDGAETKTGYNVTLSNDVKELDVDAFVKKTVDKALAKLHGVTIKSKKYKTVLSSDAVASLVNFYVGWADAEDVQKKSSRFVGKLNEKVASSKLTIEEKPLLKNVFGRGFDDEGVATYNKKIIDRGVLKTYLYNLETAKKDGVETTGNGYGGQRISVGTCNIVVKPGKHSEEELISSLLEGVYITSVTGLHAGMNSNSGNFSLQAEGFVIKDGKVGEALKMITVAGNLYDLFNDVKAVANNSELKLSGTTSCSILLKKLAVASDK